MDDDDRVIFDVVRNYDNITLPELYPTAHISAKMHVTKNKRYYDLIFGTDLLRELGIFLDFSKQHSCVATRRNTYEA